MYISLNNLGSMVLDITSNRLDVVFLRETGATNDWFTLRKDYLPVPVIFTRATFTNGRLTLAGTGPSGQSYRVWATTGLPATNWTAIGSGTFSGGVFTFTDPQSRNLPARFYRVTMP